MTKRISATNRYQIKDIDQIMDVLTQLQNKVLNSAALNGGFDTLLLKIDQIEEKQEEIGSKVDQVHEAIYKPDDGLFARVKDVEHAKKSVENVENIGKTVNQLQQLVELQQKTAEKESVAVVEREKLLKEHNDQLASLMRFQSRILAIAKWMMVTVAGSLITIIAKLTYDFISGHITLH